MTDDELKKVVRLRMAEHDVKRLRKAVEAAERELEKQKALLAEYERELASAVAESS